MTALQNSYKLRVATSFLLNLLSLIDPTVSKSTTIWRSADIVKTACDQQKEFNSTGKIPEPIKDNPKIENCGWFKKGESCPSACCDITFFRTCKNKPSSPNVEQGRIWNGNPARKYKFPSLVSIRGNKIRGGCGGSIYNEVWIITAAHCLDRKTFGDQSWLIIAADYTLYVDDGFEQQINSTKIIRHPNYTYTSEVATKFDIALIKLESPLTFNDKVQPVKLPPSGFFELGWTIIAGWGDTGLEDDIKVLQETIQPIVTTEECKKAYAGSEEVLDNMLCRGYKEGLNTLCGGDSGSPTYQCIDNELVQIGLVTWAVNDTSFCYKRTKPDVDTKVSSFIEWIKEQVSKN